MTVQEGNIMPPNPRTGVSNSRCLLSSSCDCSNKISKEHYVSASVLSHIGDIITLKGVPWLPANELCSYKISSLNAKVLCKRHNESLSTLDSSASRFFSALKRFIKADYDGEDRVEILNGRDIERWMIKTLYGLIASKSLQVSHGNSLKARINQRCVDLLYDQVPYTFGRGFFMRSAYPKCIQAQNHLMVSPILNKTQRTIQGLEFSIFGFNFLFSTCKINVQGGVFRPGFIAFESHTGSKLIRLFCADQCTEQIHIFSTSKT
jgi:hypothetical protein